MTAHSEMTKISGVHSRLIASDMPSFLLLPQTRSCFLTGQAQRFTLTVIPTLPTNNPESFLGHHLQPPRWALFGAGDASQKHAILAVGFVRQSRRPGGPKAWPGSMPDRTGIKHVSAWDKEPRRCAASIGPWISELKRGDPLSQITFVLLIFLPPSLLCLRDFIWS